MPSGVPKKKSDPKAEAIARLTALAGDETQPLKVREAAAEALTELLVPKPPEPKSEPINHSPGKYTPHTVAELQASKEWDLRRAVKQRDYGKIERLVAYWAHNWPDVPVPQFEMPPLPAPTTSATQRRMEAYVQTANKEEQDFETRLRAHRAVEDRGRALNAHREPFAQDGPRGSDLDWAIDFQ